MTKLMTVLAIVALSSAAFAEGTMAPATTEKVPAMKAEKAPGTTVAKKAKKAKKHAHEAATPAPETK